MPSYIYPQDAGVGLAERFPQWAAGYEEWLGIVSGAQPLASLRALRTPPRPSGPRLFVSHRQADGPFALRIAYLASLGGFEYWVDLLDPMLQAGSPCASQPLFAAAVIEMALANCTHIIAVMTPQTRGSLWVPYEYGRILEAAASPRPAGSWLHVQFVGLPEYLLFGEMTKTEADITAWLQRELGGPAPSQPWTGGPTTPLP
ncbi:MAG TPA: toll/interleukin-1 receptor domain-containing protein [Thermoanaerobaculia bacterium]|nr:toll/interleukin-1 receptor domain-containing protein [Thermoanaerobaculia bacterium]